SVRRRSRPYRPLKRNPMRLLVRARTEGRGRRQSDRRLARSGCYTRRQGGTRRWCSFEQSSTRYRMASGPCLRRSKSRDRQVIQTPPPPKMARRPPPPPPPHSPAPAGFFVTPPSAQQLPPPPSDPNTSAPQKATPPPGGAGSQ